MIEACLIKNAKAADYLPRYFKNLKSGLFRTSGILCLHNQLIQLFKTHPNHRRPLPPQAPPSHIFPHNR